MTETGTLSPSSRHEEGNSLNGSYTLTDSGGDSYTIVENSMDSGTTVTQTLTGTDSYTLKESGNSFSGLLTRAESGSNNHTLMESTSTTTATGSTSWSLEETASPRGGYFTQTGESTDRYSLLKHFNNVANAASGTAGHMDYRPFGQAFVDPDEPESMAKAAAGADEKPGQGLPGAEQLLNASTEIPKVEAAGENGFTNEELSNHLGALAQNAWQEMKSAYDKEQATATLPCGTVLAVKDTTRGPCLSLVMDVKTGKVYYGQNTGAEAHGLPEPLAANAAEVAAGNQMKSPAPENYGLGWSRGAGYPGSHSEVQAAAAALRARPGAGLADLAVYNIATADLSRQAPAAIPSCVNCTPILGMDSGRGAIPLTGFSVRDNGGKIWIVGG